MLNRAALSALVTSSELKAERFLLVVHVHGSLTVLAILLHHGTSLVHQFL